MSSLILNCLEDQIRIIDAEHFVVCGQRYSVSAARASDQDACDASGESLRSHYLAEIIFESLFQCRQALQKDAISTTRKLFVSDLSRANLGTGCWDAGWQVVSTPEDGSVYRVEKHGVIFQVLPEAVRDVETFCDRRSVCRVKIPKEYRNLVPDYYVALGDAGDSCSEAALGGYIHIFWNLEAGAATTLIRLLTGSLNDLNVPFRAMVLASPSEYARSDSAVLVVRLVDLEAASMSIKRVDSCISHNLRDIAPLCTHKLTKGVSIAHSLKAEQGYGIHICTIISMALWQAYELGTLDSKGYANAIAEAFEKEGVEADSPWKLSMQPWFN